MMFPRLIAAAIGLVLPLTLIDTADAATPSHPAGRAQVITVAEQPATVQFVARHYHRRPHRHYTRHNVRRHG